MSHRTILLYCMLCAQRKGKCNIFRGKTNLSVGAPADMPHGENVFLLYLKQMAEPPPIQRCAAGGEKCPISGREEWPPSGGGGVPVFTGGNAVPTARGKRGQGHRMVPLPPLDSPKPSFAPRLPAVARRNGRKRGSVPCVGQILGRCYALRSACVIRRA